MTEHSPSGTPVQPCAVCGEHTTELWEKDFPSFGRLHYRRCPHCQFISSSLTAEAEANYFRNCSFVRDDVGYISRAKTAFNLVNEMLPQLGLTSGAFRLLDYGCGQGDFLHYCLESGWQAWGYEPFYQDIRVPRNRLLSEEDLDKVRGTFDLVTAWEVVEHAEPKKIFPELLALCRPGGFVCFSTGIYNQKFHDRTWSYLAPTHRSIYSLRSLQCLVSLLQARQTLAIRFPLVDMPCLLTGEVWQNHGGNPLLFHSLLAVNRMERVDRLYLRLQHNPALRLNEKGVRWQKVLARVIYRHPCFV